MWSYANVATAHRCGPGLWSLQERLSVFFNSLRQDERAHTHTHTGARTDGLKLLTILGKITIR